MTSRFLAAFLAFSGGLSLLRTASLASNDVETVIRSISACEVCSCVAGVHPRDLVVCAGFVDVKVVSLPSFVNGFRIENASGSVVFKRGSIRTPSHFKVAVLNVRTVTFEEKSLNILSQDGSLNLQIEKVDEAHGLREFLSAAEGGNLNFSAARITNLHINGKAFDVLDKASFVDISTLHLSPFALKPNRPPKELTFEVFMERTTINTVPTDTFPPASKIAFFDCKISDIESNAFSGYAIQNVTFTQTSIARIHGQAFPEKTLITHQLAFRGCQLTSFSERAIMSAMSRLIIEDTFISSISEQAMDCTVADILLRNNTFNTLSKRAFIYKSFTKLNISQNTFQFVESGAFQGAASNPNSAFIFVGNRIASANRNALLLNSVGSTHVQDNVYKKDCHCSLTDELDMLTGDADTEFAASIRNTSLCTVPDVATNCFDESRLVLIQVYYNVLCANTAKSCQTSSLDYAWNVFQEKVEVHSNRGILLIVLLFVLASCLVVGIVTLFRWIVFTLQNRGRCEQDDEWNFTKVEERLVIPPSPIEELDVIVSSPQSSQEQHYESLPLTTTEVMLESTPSSPDKTHKEVPDVVQERPDSPKGTVGHKPQQTFYDEMLCLLKEKLDDPDNYATVVDTAATQSGGETQHLLYQDPLELNKKDGA